MFSQQLLLRGHLARVRLVVEAGEMKESMQDEYFDFQGEIMSVAVGLACRGFDRDCHVASNFLRPPFAQVWVQVPEINRREREHVGRLVFVTEAMIEVTDSFIAGEQDGDDAAQGNGLLRLRKKLLQVALIEWRAFFREAKWGFNNDHRAAKSQH